MFRTAEHGRFTVSGPVRTDLTGKTFKVGWWDLTTGAGVEPVPELQALVTAVADGGADPQQRRTDNSELEGLIETLHPGDVVTADFDFEGAGPFTICGGIYRDDSGIRWVLAGHHLAHGTTPASRLQFLTIDRRAAVPETTDERYDLFGS